MASLREAAERDGLANVRTLLATGNLIFEADGDRARVTARVDEIVKSFGLNENPAILRNFDALEAARDACPFGEAAEDRPSKLLAVFLSGTPRSDAAETLAAIALTERVALVGDTLWIDYRDGVGRSPLTPGRIDKATGTAGTARNWNTLGKLIDAMR